MDGVTESRQSGVNRDSILNELSYFHVCGGGLLPDVMHDILEGTLEYEMKLMLQQFIYEEHYFTLEELNTRMDFFHYGYMEIKDRPTPIADTTIKRSTGNLLKQEGESELLWWALIRKGC